MRLETLAVAALAAAASADEALRFTRLSPPQPGLSRRADDTAYAPEETECGDGATCAEACGAGFEECQSGASVSSCFNPAAGETCCSELDLGTTCQPGYFCAAVNASAVVCCAEGTSPEECAKLNGGAESDDRSDDSVADESSAASKGGDDDDDEAGSDADDAPDAPGSAPSRAMVPGAALAAAVFALLL